MGMEVVAVAGVSNFKLGGNEKLFSRRDFF